jgi:hypothetical protein
MNIHHLITAILISTRAALTRCLCIHPQSAVNLAQ